MVRAGTSRGKHRLGRALVVGEIALALTLLSGASLTIHSVWKLEHVDVGLKTDHVLTFFLPLPETRSKDADHFAPTMFITEPTKRCGDDYVIALCQHKQL